VAACANAKRNAGYDSIQTVRRSVVIATYRIITVLQSNGDIINSAKQRR